MRDREKQLREVFLDADDLAQLDRKSVEFWHRLRDLILEFAVGGNVHMNWRMVHMCSLLLATRGDEGLIRGLFSKYPYQVTTAPTSKIKKKQEQEPATKQQEKQEIALHVSS